jgi:hypothetical protein
MPTCLGGYSIYPLTECLALTLRHSILEFVFPDHDAIRIGELNIRANEGQLTDDEQAELESYVTLM